MAQYQHLPIYKLTYDLWEQKGAPVDNEALENLSASVTSYLGMLRQVNGYRARKSLCARVENLFINADEECTKIWAIGGDRS